jgi:tetratricopeptide (TPR) repeat protein
MRMREDLRRGVVPAVLVLGLIAGPSQICVAGGSSPPPERARQVQVLQTVALPDAGRLHPAVQRQLGEAYRSLLSVARDPEAPAQARGQAYGELGMLFMAAEFLSHAERCFGNAQVLAPAEFRWPYYAAHVLRRMGDLERSAEHLGRALELGPTDLAATVWLSRILLELGRPEAAEPLVAGMLARRPGAPALRVEAGRIALALDNAASAVEHLEAALALDPEADSIHYPLAMAYRRLGDPKRAERQLRQRRGGSGAGVPVRLPDPLMAALDGILRSPQYYRDLAFHAAAGGNWALAAAHFRTAAGAAPKVAMLRLSLGIVLERSGDARGAQAVFEEALRLDPRLYGAHYGLGALLARTGRDPEAIDRFMDAVLYNPNFAAGHLALADALRRSARPEPALASYRRVIALDPGNAAARFGEAMALVRLERYADARERLIRAIAVHPGRTEFPHALARLLAAAPDERVRDGGQALEVMRGLVETEPTTAVAETMAMTLAELGLFAEAVEWQRAAMAIAVKAARPDVAQRMASNLQLYLRRQPCRTPWREDDPDHAPGPPAHPGAVEPGRPR